MNNMNSIDLSIRVGELELDNPFVVGSEPTVKDIDQIKAAEDSGWAGASVKLSISPTPYVSYPPRYRWFKKHILVGADALWVCTATMTNGFGWLPKLLDRLKEYMQQMGYRTVRDFRGVSMRNIKSVSDLHTRPGYAVVNEELCTSCGVCVRIGHCNAITQEKGKPAAIDPEKCVACSTCVDLCPSNAIRMEEATT